MGNLLCDLDSNVKYMYLKRYFLVDASPSEPLDNATSVCICFMFSCTLLYVHSSIAIILMVKRELVALLNLSSWCLVMVEWLFLVVPWGCLRFVIVVFPDHTHLLFRLCNCNMVKRVLDKILYDLDPDVKIKGKKRVFATVYHRLIEGSFLAFHSFLKPHLSHDVASGSEITPCNKIDLRETL